MEESVIVPVGFLGVPWFLAQLLRVLPVASLAWVGAVFAASAVWPLFGLLRRRVSFFAALWGSALACSAPAFLYYANRGLFAQVPQVSLGLWLAWSLEKLAREPMLARQARFGLAIASGVLASLVFFFRPIEVLWMLPWFVWVGWGDGAKRWAEQAAAARLYKAKSLRWMGFEDTRVPLDKEGIDVLEGVMKAVKPDLVFAPWGEDTHQDHRHTSAIVRSATRYTPNVLFYEVPSTIDFLPDVYVDITKTLPAKLKALRAHKSQLNRVNVADLSIIDCAVSMAHFRGYQGRVKAAEGFKALRLRLAF
jgi:hypothetical protein